MKFLQLSLSVFLIFCSPALIASTALPDFNQYKDVKQKKTAFFDYMLPHIKKANTEIIAERQMIEKMNFSKLSNKEWYSLGALLEKYRIKDKQINSKTKQKLLKKVDIIAPSLALAQAANESAWGTSRFAKQGFNFYGQWCFTKGCGIVPKQRSSGMNHEVRKFNSPYASVKGYMLNLNSHPAFTKVRDERLKARQKDTKPTGLQMAKGLINYSERKEEYIKEIGSMIRYNKLDVLDS